MKDSLKFLVPVPWVKVFTQRFPCNFSINSANLPGLQTATVTTRVGEWVALWQASWMPSWGHIHLQESRNWSENNTLHRVPSFSWADCIIPNIFSWSRERLINFKMKRCFYTAYKHTNFSKLKDCNFHLIKFFKGKKYNTEKCFSKNKVSYLHFFLQAITDFLHFFNLFFPLSYWFI